MANSNLDAYMNNNLRAVQEKELDILCCIREICERNNIDYWLEGGTLLGAVRHGGFIPWDDDIDICMRKEDIARFNEAAKKELPQNLFLQSTETDPSYNIPVIKIRDNNSLMVEYGDDFNRPYHKGLFVDIFPLMPYPNISRNFCKKITKNYCKAFGILHNQHTYSLKAVAEFVWFGLKMIIIQLIWKVANLFLKKDTYYSHLLSNNGYGIMHRNENVFPLKPITFEGETFLGPANPDGYLKEQYGDYMQLPPVEKRQRHAAFYIDKLV